MTEKELDELYDTAYLLMRTGRWSLIDDLLEFYAGAAWRMDIDLLLGWATVTNVARSKLKNRKRFLGQCMRFHNREGLWKGLYEDDTDPIPFLKSIGLGEVIHEIPKH